MDEPNPKKDEDKAARIARGHANLIPAKKGEVRNKTGRNQWSTQTKMVIDFLDELDPEANKARVLVVLEKQYERAKGSGKDGERAAAGLVEHYKGKARAEDPTTQLDLAEHLRRVASDQWHVIIQAMGDKIKSMEPKEASKMVADAIAKANTDPRKFLEAAMEYVSGHEAESSAEPERQAPEEPRRLEDGQPENGNDDERR